MAKTTKTKKKIKVEPEGMVHISATFNNIIVTITDNAGNTISWNSAGRAGFKGSKKNTPYAGMVAASACSKEAYELGLRKVNVYVRGTGAGRESAIRAVTTAGIEVKSIQDYTPIPHNGCRPPKRRRV